MNISITGTLGSGKSSVCRLLKENGYEVISNGVLFREIAQEKGVSVVELNEIAKKDKSIDDMLDERSIRLGKELDETVFDSRMGWHFIPHSFKVFLLADMKEAGRRVYHDNRVSESYENERAAQEVLIKRQLMEKKRFLDLYQTDYLDLSHYDLVIESTYATPEEIAEHILEALKNHETGKKYALLNPKSLFMAAQIKEGPEPKVTVLHNKFVVTAGEESVVKRLQQGETFVKVTFDDNKGVSLCDENGIREYEKCHHFTYLEMPDDAAETILEITVE